MRANYGAEYKLVVECRSCFVYDLREAVLISESPTCPYPPPSFVIVVASLVILKYKF